MDEDERRVADFVHGAFRGVVLGNGVGLRQARGLDDYADGNTLAVYRAQDEKQDWTAISFEDLNHYSDSLSFFDAEGMRFHLPAFLISNLEDTGPDITFHLLHPASHRDPRFELLDSDQRHVVREFLLLRLSKMCDAQRGFEGPLVEDALSRYWTA
jgi:hypothetical protein